MHCDASRSYHPPPCGVLHPHGCCCVAAGLGVRACYWGGVVSVVISLCDLTGNMAQPWVDAGHDVILVDPQHGMDNTEGRITRLARTVLEAMPELGEVIRSGEVAAVFGFPPCTDMAVSGARWFETKRLADPAFFGKAIDVAEQCRTLGVLSGAPWFVENPVSTLAQVFGKPDHWFHPWHYAALEPNDNYTKRTNLWAGGGFIMPAKQVEPALGEPDNRIHMAAPGPERANFRSATPMGFARAVFNTNARVTL